MRQEFYFYMEFILNSTLKAINANLIMEMYF